MPSFYFYAHARLGIWETSALVNCRNIDGFYWTFKCVLFIVALPSSIKRRSDVSAILATPCILFLYTKGKI